MKDDEDGRANNLLKCESIQIKVSIYRNKRT